MSLGKVSIAIEAQMAGFESDMGRAARVADKNFKAMERDAKRAEDRFKEFGKQAGLALVALGTAAAVALKSTINAMDDMSKSAQKVGASTEEFSKLTYAAGLANVPMETLVGSLGKLTKSQAAALKGTGEQALVFEALGIAVKDADGNLRESTDVLAEFADKFQALEGSPEAMAAGFSLFGRSFQNLIPLLKDGGDGIRAAGAELEAFGGVLSSEAGAQAEEFNDNLTRLKTAAQSLSQAVASALLPDLVGLSGQLVSTSKDGETLAETAQEIADAIRVAGELAKFVWAPFKALGDVAAGAAMGFVGLAEAARGLIKLDWDQIGRGIEVAQQGSDLAFYGEDKASAMRPGVYSTAPNKDNSASTGGRRGRAVSIRETTDQSAVDAYTRQLQSALSGPAKKPSGGGAKANAGPSDAEREADALLKKYEGLAASQREQIALFGQTGEAAQVRYEIENGELAKLSDIQKQDLITGAERLDMMRAEEEVASLLADESKRQEEAFSETNAQILKQIDLVGMSAAEQETWNNLAWAGVDAESAKGKEIIANTTLLQQQRYAMDDQIGAMDAMRSAGANFITDMTTGSKSFKDAMLSALNSIYERIMQIIAENLMDQLFGKQGDPGGGSAGGWIGGLLGMSFGGTGGDAASAAQASGDFGAFNPNVAGFGGGRAMGGPVSGGKFYEVGEKNRPEIFSSGGKSFLVPGNDGAVTPMRGGGTVQNNSFAFSAPTSSKTQAQVSARVGYELRRASRFGA